MIDLSAVISELFQLDCIGDPISTSATSFDCLLRNDSSEWKVNINLSPPFPNSPPKILLQNPQDYGLLPHVSWMGEVCYFDQEGLSVDTSNPNAIVEKAILDAVSLLARVSGSWAQDRKLEDEFFSEFEGYWNTQASILSAVSFIPITSEVKKVSVVLSRGKAPADMCIFTANDNNDLGNEYEFLKEERNGHQQVNSIYLPLDRYASPPLPGIRLSASFVNTAIQALSEKNIRKFSRLINKTAGAKRTVHLFFSMPRPGNEKSMFGIELSWPYAWEESRLLCEQESVAPIKVQRHNREYLIRRAGGESELNNSRINIIGCGAVGSVLAELLVKSGVRNLNLYDHDIFSVDNIFRHTLSSSYVGMNKAKALKKQLGRYFPYLNINAVPNRVTGDEADIWNCDLVVLALGEPTLERILSRAHRAHNTQLGAPSLVATWLEPEGLGGHAIVVRGKGNGCLNCLYHRDNSPQLSSLVSFVEPGQKFAQSLTGCAGSFTLFGAADAHRTASIAVKLCIRALRTNEGLAEYSAWHEDTQEDTNLKLSPWRQSHDFSMAKNRVSKLLSQGCPDCRGA